MNFELALLKVLRERGLATAEGPDPLAALTYSKELDCKREAFRLVSRDLGFRDAHVYDVVAAPQPRHYRTTSRRRVAIIRGRPMLAHGDGRVEDLDRASTLEPDSHHKVYATITAELDRMRALPKKRTDSGDVKFFLNHVIVRGTDEELVVIFNVRLLDASLVRLLRGWTVALRRAIPAVAHVWIYNDPSGSRYYLEQDRPPGEVGAKKLHGAAATTLNIHGVIYQVGVFSFSQVNRAMMPELVQTVRRLALEPPLRPQGGPLPIIYDLYGGYGFFGAALAEDAAHIIEVDADETTVANARYNVKRVGGHVTALTMPVTATSVERRIPQFERQGAEGAPVVVILDPPRSGTAENVIAALAARNPDRVIHVFCGPDEISRSMKEWRAAGYVADIVVPLDLFPGTAGFEVIVRLVPAPKVSDDVREPRRRR